MARIGCKPIQARNFAPVLISAGALGFKAAERQLRGSMALLRGGAIELFRLDIVLRNAEAAAQTNAEVVLRIGVALRGRATE
jgi:hypothetical protein